MRCENGFVMWSIAPYFQTGGHLIVRAERRDHHDRNPARLGITAQLTQHADPVHFRHQHVKQNEVRLLEFRAFNPCHWL
jgi:hypothetical protein